MKPTLDLAPYLITPGTRVIVREAESRRARDAYARSRVRELLACRGAFSGGAAA